MKKLSKKNTSGTTGVDRVGSRWRVRIMVRGTNIHVGMFAGLFEAKCARRAAEAKYGVVPRKLSPPYTNAQHLQNERAYIEKQFAAWGYQLLPLDGTFTEIRHNGVTIADFRLRHTAKTRRYELMVLGWPRPQRYDELSTLLAKLANFTIFT